MNDILGAFKLILRPYLEDLDGVWKLLRGLSIAAFISSCCLWFFSYLAAPEYYARAKMVLNLTGWFTFALFVIAYVSIYVEVYYQDRDKEEEKIKRVKEFR